MCCCDITVVVVKHARATWQTLVILSWCCGGRSRGIGSGTKSYLRVRMARRSWAALVAEPVAPTTSSASPTALPPGRLPTQRRSSSQPHAPSEAESKPPPSSPSPSSPLRRGSARARRGTDERARESAEGCPPMRRSGGARLRRCGCGAPRAAIACTGRGSAGVALTSCGRRRSLP